MWNWRNWLKIKLPRKGLKTENLAWWRNRCSCYCSCHHDVLMPPSAFRPESPFDYNHRYTSDAITCASRAQLNLKMLYPWKQFTSAAARKMVSTPSLLPQIVPFWIKVSYGRVPLVENGSQGLSLTTKETGKHLSEEKGPMRLEFPPNRAKSTENPENIAMWGIQVEQSGRWWLPGLGSIEVVLRFELCLTKIYMLISSSPLPQNVPLLGDRVFPPVIKVKRDHKNWP